MDFDQLPGRAVIGRRAGDTSEIGKREVRRELGVAVQPARAVA